MPLPVLGPRIQMSANVIPVASGKGGVGKTITAVNLAVNLRMRDQSVVLVDGDLGMPNIAEWFGICHASTLHDVLAGNVDLADAIVRKATGFGVLPGDANLSGYSEADPTRFAYVIDRLEHEYDIVMIDTGGGLSYENTLPLQVADGIILVTSPDPPAVSDTKRTKHLIDIIDGEIRGLVVTKAADLSDGQEIANEVDVPLLGTVPFSETVEEAARQTQPMELFDSNSDVAKSYRNIAQLLVEPDEPIVGDPIES